MRTTLDPTLDIVFKLLFSGPESREALTSLLTAVLRPPRPIVEVRVLNPWIPGMRVDDKGVVLDILVVLDDGTRINVEMQATRRPGLPVRALFYWSRAFSTQLDRGQPYSNLRPVVSILFLDYVELDTPRFHSTFRLLEAQEHFPFSDALEIHVIELPKRHGPPTGPPGVARQEDADLLAWTRFLGATSDEEVTEASGPASSESDVGSLRFPERNGPVITLPIIDVRDLDPAQRETLEEERRIGYAFYQMERATVAKEGFAEGFAEGLAEARAERVLRTIIADLAEVLEIELDPPRREQLKQASLDELKALRDRLKKERRW